MFTSCAILNVIPRIWISSDWMVTCLLHQDMIVFSDEIDIDGEKSFSIVALDKWLKIF